MNKRIWIWINGDFVRITIPAQGSIEFWEGGLDDEGYSYTYYSYYQDRGNIVSEVRTEARDCDGRLDRYWSGVMCGERVGSSYTDNTLPRVRGGVDFFNPPTEYELLIPNWEKRDCGQRDYSAEAMGY